MFKSSKRFQADLDTRAQILNTALDLFRQKGLDGATMRHIAESAGVALGAAYYYFSSKEAIVQAYYEQVQKEHLDKVSASLAEGDYDLLERLKLAFRLKLDILKGDRRLLGALFRYSGEPEHPLSVFGAASRVNREQSIAVFRLATENEDLPEDIHTALPLALWALHMATLLYFIYDDSPEQQRTHRLADGALEFLVRMISLIKSPLLKGARSSVFALLRDAGLFPEPSSPAPQYQQEA
jgi:AcrR family transcriptional regulator